MKKQINPTIKAHLIRGAFYLLLLLAVCAIPFVLAKPGGTKAMPFVSKQTAAANAAHFPVAARLSGQPGSKVSTLSTKRLIVKRPDGSSTLWYNGDFNGINGLANEDNTSLGSGEFASVYDDFIVGDSEGWNVTAVFSDNLSSTNITGATWEIRQGVAEGTGGTLIASGMTMTPVVTATGRSGFGFTEFMVEVTGLSVNLPQSANPYWLNVTPIGDLTGRSFDSTTSGANCVGTPCGNDLNAFFNSNFFGANWQNTAEQGQPSDFSMGVIGTVGAGTPSPTPTASPTPTCPINYTTTTSTGVITPGGTDIGSHCDDCNTDIVLPFSVNVYGVPVSVATIGSDGDIQLTATPSEKLFFALNQCVPVNPDPASHGPFLNTLFPYYADLLTTDSMTTTCPDCGVFTQTVGSPPNRQFIIRYKTTYFNFAGTAEFEVILTEGSDTLTVIYGDSADQGLQATTSGIQQDLNVFTSFSCNEAVLTSGLRVDYIPPSCASPTPTATATATATPTATAGPRQTPTPRARPTPAHRP